jgi:hypothetical protein
MKLFSGEEIELHILGMPPMASADITKHGWRNGVKCSLHAATIKTDPRSCDGSDTLGSILPTNPVRR